MSRRLLSSNKYPYYSRQRVGSWSFSGEDRISDLPNDVLCRILSFLPSTKCVVRTSILSKFWKKIWASVPNLCFRDEDFLSSDDFIAFVDRVLLLRGSSAINKFHLQFNSCPPEDLCRIDHWISAAARCNVVELVFAVSSSDGKQIFKLPVSLATCRTVEVLRLMSLFIIDNLPPRTSFTSLKCLHIHFTAVNYGEYNSIAGLDFSALEHFSIDGDPERHLMDLNISAPRLKTMTIEFSSSHGNHKYYNIDIDAQNLEKLEIKEGTLSNFILENTKSLVKANIEIYLHHIEEDHVPVSNVRRATEFLAALSAVKYLSLSWCFYEGCSVPAFNNLIQLKLVHYGCSHWWKNLMQLLERSPNLQCLFIENGNYPKRKQLEVEEIDEEEDELIEHTGNEAPVSDITDITNYTSVQTWSPPNTVPNCLLSHLKTIAIRGFIGKGCIGYLEEMEVTKYLLINGRVLEQVTIYTPGLFRETKKDIWKETGMILWGSKFVCVEVIQKMIDV